MDHGCHLEFFLTGTIKLPDIMNKKLLKIPAQQASAQSCLPGTLIGYSLPSPGLVQLNLIKYSRDFFCKFTPAI